MAPLSAPLSQCTAEAAVMEGRRWGGGGSSEAIGTAQRAEQSACEEMDGRDANANQRQWQLLLLSVVDRGCVGVDSGSDAAMLMLLTAQPMTTLQVASGEWRVAVWD